MCTAGDTPRGAKELKIGMKSNSVHKQAEDLKRRLKSIELYCRVLTSTSLKWILHMWYDYLKKREIS